MTSLLGIEEGSVISLVTAADFLYSAESRNNEMQLQKMAFEGRAMHERQLSTLEELRKEVAAQRPTLLAGMDTYLERPGKMIETTSQEEGPIATVSIARRRRSYDPIPIRHNNTLLLVRSNRPRSRSEEHCRVSEDHDEPLRDDSEIPPNAATVWSKPRSHLDANTTTESPKHLGVSARSEPLVSLQVSHRQPSQCRRPCSCQCHRSSKLKTPDFLRYVTGQLLVGYTGIQNITPPCNEHACAQRQQAVIRIQYNFPVWSLIQRVLTLVSYSGGLCGPEKILRMSRIRPGLDEVFIQVQSGNVRRLQRLFIQGSASPLDASDTGWTLLHYALSAGQLPTVKFLKDAGADVRAESTSRETPIDVAWNRILSGCLDAKSEDLLRTIFDDDAQLDERQFTTLHKIVLGLLGKDLAEELEVTTAHINSTDSSGNTPLSWASARGDLDSVLILLEHGASFDIANDVNAKPIHLAAQTGNVPTIRALVQAGADVNDVVPRTQMTPLHYAAEYQDSSEQIHALASLGAQIDGTDYLSWTPLHWASWRGHLSSLSALLDCGADFDAKTLDGNASMMLAVANNSHRCVQRLIEAGADCSIVRDTQWNILHYAAIGGSVDTLRSLATANLSGIDIQGLRTRETGQTVADMLQARIEAMSAEEQPEKRVAWKHAWNCLVAYSTPELEINFDPEPNYCLIRSDTDSIYVDANDQPFGDQGDEQE